MLNVVLLEPEIPPNTGNIARLCAATGASLHLIEPLGFVLDDKALRRAGMDYWRWVRWRVWPSWHGFHSAQPSSARFWFVESCGPSRYTDVEYAAGDYLVFGRETAGLPRALLEQNQPTWVRLPMLGAEARSLNLSNCVAVVVYEALRQFGFPGEYRSGAGQSPD